MERRIINPWTWQDAFGFVQANEITGAQRVLLCSGQLSCDAEGTLLHPDDMPAQVRQAMDNLETVLKAADLTLANVVRLNFYVTDVDAFFASFEALTQRLAAAGCRQASTLLGVSRLAFAGQVVEIEATAVA